MGSRNLARSARVHNATPPADRRPPADSEHTPDAPAAAKRSRHRLYYALGAFNVVSVLVAIALGYAAMAGFSTSVDVNARLVGYREARTRWIAGDSFPFPVGTYWLRRFAAVPLAS